MNIEELFEDKADEAGFCLDKKWGQHKNPYLDKSTRNAFDFFRSGFLTAENRAAEKLQGCVVVPVEPTEEMMVNALAVIATGVGTQDIDFEIRKIWEKMLEAARGGK